MTEKEVLEQIKALRKLQPSDEVAIYTKFQGKPVYYIANPLRHGKIGLPKMYMVNQEGVVFELDFETRKKLM